MKLKKIFAGMAASAIAMTTFAMTATTASALDNAGNAGIAFQMEGTYNFRNVYGDGDTAATFPGTAVGVQGAAYGLDTNAACGDTTIQYDGTYSVSIATSGTINQAPDNTKDWFIDEAKGITREGSPWSMIGNYNPKTTDDSVELTQDNIEWEQNAKSASFNHLLITTDIPCEYNDDNQAVINGEVIKVTNVTVDMCGTTYTADTGVYKTDTDTLTIALINNYNKDGTEVGVGSTIDPTAMPAADGTITATFTISGLGADPNAVTESSSTASADSTASTTSTTTNNNNNNNKSGSTTSKNTTTSTTTSVASDKTENAPAGAPAGIALALAAVAGAAIVVSRKK